MRLDATLGDDLYRTELMIFVMETTCEIDELRAIGRQFHATFVRTGHLSRSLLGAWFAAAEHYPAYRARIDYVREQYEHIGTIAKRD